MRGLVILLLLVCWCSTALCETVHSVGTFGGFVEEENNPGKVVIPNRNGFLTYAADNNVQAHDLLWRRFDKEGTDYILARMRFPTAIQKGNLKFVDWSTLKIESPDVEITMSKTLPAVMYKARTSSFSIETGLKNRKRYSHMAMVINGRITHYNFKDFQTYNISGMSEPWILLWAGQDNTRDFDAPILLKLQHRPKTLHVTKAGIRFSFGGTVGIVNALPLRGVKAYFKGETHRWARNLPGYAIVESRAWVEKLAAFPVGMKEVYQVDEKAKLVRIKDYYRYDVHRDVWGTTPNPVAPLPPVVLRAKTKGYPVRYPDQSPIMTKHATFYGFFGYQKGQVGSYTIPLANALDRLPIALNVTNSKTASEARSNLIEMLNKRMPTKPSSFYVHNDDIASALMCDSYSTLFKNDPLRKKLEQNVKSLFSGSLQDHSAPISREPVTGQYYRSPGKHQYEHTPFDREWYTGRKLAAIARCAEAIDINIAKKNWNTIKGLYRYSQIFFDWVTGSVTSSVYGYNQLADGIHFIWEGVLGVARMARHIGDKETFKNAAYRASRQQLALFTIWHQANWALYLDYAIGHYSLKRLPPHMVETRGAVDAWVEDFGSATLEFKSIWQTSNFIFIDNQAQYALYRDFGIDKKVKNITYHAMPGRHPNWKDGNVFSKQDNKYYGSGSSVAHLSTRALLFHHDPTELLDIFNDFEGTEVTKQWYTPYFFGNSGPLMLAIERAKAPVVEAPVGNIKVEFATYNSISGISRVEYQCRQDGKFNFRYRFEGGSWKTKSIYCKKNIRSVVSF